MSDRSQFVAQIRHTIAVLEQHLATHNDPPAVDILTKYKVALSASNSESSAESTPLQRLKMLARGYLETSSSWDQPFIHEMGKTEAMLTEF